jgi:hypothetical protein
MADCVLTLPPFPKFGFRSLHAATICGSICGKAVARCFVVPNMIGRIQSDMIPRHSWPRWEQSPPVYMPARSWRKGARVQVEWAQIERLVPAKE